MEKIKHIGFFKYGLIVLMLAFCSFFPNCDPEGFEVHFVIVGGIPGVPTHDGIIRYAENCTIWDNTNNYMVNDSSLFEITYYHDRFVAVGSEKGVYFSEDGITWTRGNISGCGIFYGIAGGESNSWTQPWVAHYVAVGTGGMVYFSTNGGLDWTLASDSKTTATLFNVAFGSVVIEGNSVSRFVAVGEVVIQPLDIDPPMVTIHNIIWSQDGGDNWFGASSGSPSETLWGVGYGNSRFVAVGMHGAIIYSDNGAGWNTGSPATDTPGNFSGVAYGNGIWVAVGGWGLIWYSLNNGVNWQEANSPTNNFSFTDVVFDGTQFVASSFNTAGEGVVITSTDGINWSIVKTFGPSQYGHLGIAFKPY